MEQVIPVSTSLITNALTPKWTSFIPQSPTVRQHAALLLDHVRELLYGGAAGGAKSSYLLMAALQYADVPRYSALVMRRTFPQLAQADGLLERASDWLTGKAQGVDSVSGTPTRWIFPSGASLTFAHCQHEKDRYNFQGGAWQFIAFDELTQFSERIYRYLFSRLRRLSDTPVPLRVRGASNPGGEGHEWVKSRFITHDSILPSEDKPMFLAAKLMDNPHLDTRSYVESLQHLASVDREQLLNGNWDARPEGGLFKREWFGQLLDITPSNLTNKVRRWDIAATEERPGTDPDWAVGLLLERDDPTNTEYITDVERFRGTPNTVDQRLLDTAHHDGAGVKIRIEQEPGSAGKIAIEHFRKLLHGFDVKGVPSSGDKAVRAGPVISAAEHGNVKLKRGPWNETFLRELEMFTGEGHGHDDQVDALSGAHYDVNFVKQPGKAFAIKVI